MSKLKCVHVVSGIGSEASGLAVCVPDLCRALLSTGVDVDLVSCDSSNLKVEGVPFRTFPTYGPWAENTCRSPDLYKWLRRQSENIQVMHNHHLWRAPNIYPAFVTRHTNCKLVSSTHGSLAKHALKHSFWQKRIIWHLVQSRVLKFSSCVHATSESEYNDIREMRIGSPIAIIPLAYDPPPLKPKSRGNQRRRLLYLGRKHPIKGVETLIDAWSLVESNFPDWDLHLVGPGDADYLGELDNRIKRLRIPRIFQREAVYGEAKLEEYSIADLFVLPSHSENFAMTVPESLGQGTPVIATQGTPWRGLVDNRCGWWIKNEASVLAETLREAMALNTVTLENMGLAGRVWIQNTFSSKVFAERISEIYEWVTHGGSCPSTVRSN